MRAQLRDNSLDLTVVIPTLNEGENLATLIPQLRRALDELDVGYEILVVDGGSQDDTPQVVKACGATYILEITPGYGRAVLRGVSEARGAYVLTMDADQSHPSDVVKSLWDVRENADITIASRYVPGGRADQPWLRSVLSRTLNAVFRSGLDIDLRDLSSGYRLYRKAVFRGLEVDFTNFVMVVDVLLRARARGFTTQEIPFHYQPRSSGASKARVINFGKDYLRLFWRVWTMRKAADFPDYDWRVYDSRFSREAARQRTRNRIVLNFVPRAASVCYVGCGTRRGLARLPGAVGVDPCHDKLMFMRRTNRLLVQADRMRLPFPANAFACVVCGDIVDHEADELGPQLDECSRILDTGGILIIGTRGRAQRQVRGLESSNLDERDRLTRTLAQCGYTVLDQARAGRSEVIVKAKKGAAGIVPSEGSGPVSSAIGRET